MAKTGDAMERPSRVDRYLPRWAIEEVLRARQPAPGTPRVVAAGGTGLRSVLAEPLAGGGLLYRLPRPGR
ncbi:MAG TPA: hypothetical protein VGN83_20915 [Falsiroseomonas sp.]|jgi:hypothetical protein|nr:hypothetical protein [Falsiroseomonas sp.]